MIIDIRFGSILRSIRINNKQTLRQRCKKLKYDPGNYSKLERNELPPPPTRHGVERLIDGLKVTTLEHELFISAAINHHVGKVMEGFK